MGRKFWLVQRLSLRTPAEPTRGFDGFFGLQYMGSSEYEFGTPNDSLKAMRSKKLALSERTIKGKTVYFVAATSDLDANLDDFTKWLELEGYQQSKENSYFNQALAGEPLEWADVDAWWSFTDNIAWTLDPAVAQTLLKAFETKAAK